LTGYRRLRATSTSLSRWTSHFRFPSALQRAGTGTGEPRPVPVRRHRSGRIFLFFVPILLFGPQRSHSLAPAAQMTQPGARSGRQGWRTCATARLVLDAREHDGMLTRHWARHIATTARQLPRWHQHQIPSACSLSWRELLFVVRPRTCPPITAARQEPGSGAGSIFSSELRLPRAQKRSIVRPKPPVKALSHVVAAQSLRPPTATLER